MSDILSELKNKYAEAGIRGRGDLVLHDQKVLDSGSTIKVLATYSKALGVPTTPEVVGWFTDRLGPYANSVQAHAESVVAYPEGNFVVFTASLKQVRKPLSAKATMVSAGVSSFVDEGSKVWEIVKGDNGPQFLVRKESESVAEMIQARKAALAGRPNPGGAHRVVLAQVDQFPTPGGGRSTVGIGDIVDFHYNGLSYRGRVQSKGDTGLIVKTKADTFTIDPLAVYNVAEQSAMTEKEQDTVFRRYYQNVWPGNPEMVKEISPLATEPVAPPSHMGVEGVDVPVRPFSASVEVTARPTMRVAAKEPTTHGVGARLTVKKV